jgi:hypothetical protein
LLRAVMAVSSILHPSYQILYCTKIAHPIHSINDNLPSPYLAQILFKVSVHVNARIAAKFD